MIEIGDFYKLRLKDFLPNRNLDRAWFTSYLGSYWFGQTYYFTDILQPANNPFKTHSLSVEFERLENDEITSIFKILGIPVDSNFTYERMIQSFGSPEDIEEYVKDRKTYTYKIGSEKEFQASFTLINDKNIAFFNMHTVSYA